LPVGLGARTLMILPFGSMSIKVGILYILYGFSTSELKWLLTNNWSIPFLSFLAKKFFQLCLSSSTEILTNWMFWFL
jgi:hypothetical protein